MKTAKVKTATNPVMSVTVCVDLNAVRVTVVVYLRKSQSTVPTADKAQVGQMNRRPGQDSLANSSSHILTNTRCVQCPHCIYSLHLTQLVLQNRGLIEHT